MRARRPWPLATMAVLAVSTVVTVAPADAATAAPGPDLAVDVLADRQPISEDIYGMNFASEELAAELRLPVQRWGGNSTTRYNFRFDNTNRASDWYFENIDEATPDPAALPDGSVTDLTHERNVRTGSKSLFTVPLIGWVPKARGKACGFSVAKYGPQQSTDSWAPDCGNGVRPDGTNVTGNDPHDTSVEAGAQYVEDWIHHLTGKYGTAAGGGVRYYDLDNEPDLWQHTHRDVHPQGAGAVELRDRTYDIGAAVKAADPSAKTMGPVGWGYMSLLHSGLGDADRPNHGGVDFGEWYLAQMRAYEQQHGVRILDYYDNHIYPQQSGVSSSDAGDAGTQALRLRSTRQLWDPTYVDESWINDKIRFIPRMKDMVARNYPGTKTAITEYSWGAFDSVNGALAQADVLGIFGREGLDLATLWTAPSAGQPVADAFRMYRDYDGRGGRFGDTRIRATSTDQDKVSIYGAERATDGATTLMVVNKTGGDLTSPVAMSGRGAGTAQVYRYSGADPTGIVHEADQAVSATGFTATLPAGSITLYVIPKDDTPTLPAPGAPTASDLTATGVTLSWPAVTGAADYTVERDGSPAGRTATTTLAVTGLKPDTAYTFTVRANNAAGTSSPPSPALTVRTKPDQSGTGCTAAVTVTGKWPGQFQLDLTVRNRGTTSGTGWTASLGLAGGMSVAQTWNGVTTTTGTTATVRNASWNGALAPGAFATAGMILNGDPAGWTPTPTCSLT
ncbi:endoglucanase [Amycolatopsis mediterranei S699]|uniref:Endoglucanase n=1 Tax=Amycolatopsis mediterranei (strain U-32) TaxID=749927 RepID=A0A0H3DHB9_AMYMU|nr:endoglucanase [Amycolatopsis mediterranei U32]AFO81242.1 endoglucanase [Amycolatopsis mediterranei S699]AGT88370.1 endoglucanase [Amycolatopsis mediterranei RB]KDO04930.1 endoglucanase [Amycolatopsis mediterranei]KDU89157.1 endoglucanase [Amycolatopsis mediterranei]